MSIKKIVLMITVFASFTTILPQAFAEPTVSISMEKTTFSYCDYLFYTIEVSEVTGDSAIIHIRDETGKGSSAIPIAINELENPIPSLVPFEEGFFPLGKYFIDVQYSGSEYTAEFTLIDSGKICMPQVIRPILSNWLTGNISDGFLVDSFQKYVDPQLIEIPFEINEDNVYDIQIPPWVKNPAFWWIQGAISDDEFAQTINYLIEEKIIDFEKNTGPEI